MTKKRQRAEQVNDRIDLLLTEEIIEEAVAIIQRGNFRYVAAQALGVPPNTFYAWINKGKKELQEFHDGDRKRKTIKATFAEEVEKAEAECHKALIEDVRTSDNVQAKLWFLERRYNKLYSKNPNAQVDDESGETLKLDAAAILAEKLKQFLED